MFGHKDKRDDKNMLSRMISMSALGVAGVGLWNWSGKYGYRTRKLLGFNVPEYKIATRELFNSMQSLFYKQDTGMGNLSLESFKFISEDTGVWTGRYSKERIVDDIIKIKEKLGKYQGEYDNLLETFKNKGNDNYRAIKHYIQQTTNENVTIDQLKTLDFKYLYNKGNPFKMGKEVAENIDHILANWEPMLTKFKDERFVDSVYTNIISKFPVLTKGSLEDDATLVDKLDGEQLNYFKKELNLKTYKIKDDLLYLKNQECKFNVFSMEYPQFLLDVKSRIETINNPFKYVASPVAERTEIMYGSLDIKNAFSYLQSNINDKNYTDEIFYNKLFGKLGNKFRTGVVDALKDTGYDRNFKSFMSVSPLMKNITSTMDPVFGKHISDLFKIIYNSGFPVDDISVGWRSLSDSNHMIFHVKTHDTKGIPGEFKFPIILSKKMKYQPTALHTPVNIMEVGDPVWVQVQAYKNEIGGYFQDSVSTNAGVREALQGKIDHGTYNRIGGLSATGDILPDLAKGARVSDKFYHLKIRGLMRRGGAIANAIADMGKFKGINILNFIDAEFDKDSDGNPFFKSIAFTRAERNLNTGDITPVGGWSAQLLESKGKAGQFSVLMSNQTDTASKVVEPKIMNTREFIDYFVNYISQGKVISKNSFGEGSDFDQIVRFLQKNASQEQIEKVSKNPEIKLKFKTNVGIAMQAMKHDQWQDMQSLMHLHITDLPSQVIEKNKVIETLPDRIEDLLIYLDSTPQGPAARKYKTDMENMMGMKVADKAFHNPRWDSMAIAIYTPLITDFRWDKIHNKMDFYDQSKIIEGELRKRLDRGFMSSSAYLNKVGSLIEPSRMIVGYDMSLKTSPMYQILNATTLKWRNKGLLTKSGRFALPLTMDNTQEAWRGLTDSHFAIMWFFDPTLQDQQLLVNKKLLNDFSMRERGRRSIIIDAPDRKVIQGTEKLMVPGTEIRISDHRGEIFFGMNNGKEMSYKGRYNIKIISAQAEGNKIAIKFEELIPPSVVSKFHTFFGLRNMRTDTFSGFAKLGESAPMIVAGYSPFAKENPGSLLHMLIGNLAWYAGMDPKSSGDFLKAFNTDEKISKVMVAQRDISGKLTVSWRGEIMNLSNKNLIKPNELLDSILNVYKKMGLTQDLPAYIQEKADIVRWDMAQGNATTKELQKAGIDRILLMARDADFKAYMETNWLKHLNMPANEIVKKLADNDPETISKVFSEKTPLMFSYMERTSPSGIKLLYSGIPGFSGTYLSSPLPFASDSASEVKISPYFVKGLEFIPAYDKVVSTLYNDIKKQSWHNIGRYAWHTHINVGESKPLGMDLLNPLTGIENMEKRKQVQALYERFLNAKPSLASAKDATFYAYRGKRYSAEEFRSMKDLDLIDDAYEVMTAGELFNKGRTFKAKDLEFLDYLKEEYSGLGYVKSNKAVFMKVPGRPQSWTTLQLFPEDFTLVDKMGRTGGGENAIISEEALTMKNLLVSIKSGNPGWEESYHRLADLMLSSRVNGLAEARLPGMNAMLQFGKPYIDPIYENMTSIYNDETVLTHEMLLQKGWLGLKRNRLNLESAIKNIPAEDYEFIEKYMRNYNTVVPGSPIKVHPNYTRYQHKNISIGPGESMKFDELLNLMKDARKSTDFNRLQKYYTKAVKKELLPIPVLGARMPISSSHVVRAAFGFFRDFRLPSPTTDAIVRASSYIMKLWGADTDGDHASILLAPAPFKKAMTWDLANPINTGNSTLQYVSEELFKGSLPTGGIFDKTQEPFDLFFNTKTKGFNLLPRSEFLRRLEHDPKEIAKSVFTTGYFDDDILQGMMARWGMIKQAPSTATQLLYSYGIGIQTHLKDATAATRRTVFDELGTILEWGTKQKSTKLLHDIQKPYSMLQDLTPSNLIKLEKLIGSGDIPDLPNLLHTITDENAFKGSDLYIPSALKNKRSILALLGSVYARMPEVGKYGDNIYRISHGKGSTMRDVVIANFIGDTLPSWLSNAAGIESTLPYKTADMSFGEGFKRMLNRSFDKGIVDKMQLSGKLALGVGAAFLAYNFINPNNTKYLGHIPGKGGEYWDWTFSKPELDWSAMMQTPLSNRYDVNKTYIDMDNPILNGNIDKRNSRYKRLYVAGNNELSSVINNRTTFEF